MNVSIEKNFKDNNFRLELEGKSRTYISASLLLPEICIFADFGGNVWSLSTETKKMQWKSKLKKAVLFPFLTYKNNVYVISSNTVYSLCITTGTFNVIKQFGVICSLIQSNNLIIFNDRNKSGQNTTGKIIQFNLDDFSSIELAVDDCKRTYGRRTKREIDANDDNLWYFSNNSIFHHSFHTRISTPVFSVDPYEGINAIVHLKNSVLVVPAAKTQKSNGEQIPRSEYKYSPIIHITKDSVNEISGTLDRARLAHQPSVLCIKSISIVAIAGHLLTFKGDKLLANALIHERFKHEYKLFSVNNTAYLLVSCNHHENGKSIQGFELYRISSDYCNIKLMERYKAYETGANFMPCHFDLFNDRVVVRGDRRFFVLKTL
jgi:hypothetical protein